MQIGNKRRHFFTASSSQSYAIVTDVLILSYYHLCIHFIFEKRGRGGGTRERERDGEGGGSRIALCIRKDGDDMYETLPILVTQHT